MQKLVDRDYQTRAVRALPGLLSQHQKVLVVSPTGSGKTVIGSMLIRAMSEWRVLWLAYRQELIGQARDRLVDMGLDVGVMMASYERVLPAHANRTARIQVASVPTVLKRGTSGKFDLVVIDEAHRTMADSYRRVAGQHPEAAVLGLTATPCRMDGRGLSDFYAHMIVVARPSELYDSGHLFRPTTYSSPDQVSLCIRNGLRRSESGTTDFSQETLRKIVDNGALVGEIVSESERLAAGKRKVVFACSVSHSRSIADAFASRGIKSEHLDGLTPNDERARMLERLRTGETEVICNVDVLSEGWDLPILGAVVIARPTKSLAKFLQMAGRVMRVADGKDRPLIIDHGDNYRRFQSDSTYDVEWSLEHGRIPLEPGTDVVKTCVKCYACIPAGCQTCPQCASDQPARLVDRTREETAILLEQMRDVDEADTRNGLLEMRDRISKSVLESDPSRITLADHAQAWLLSRDNRTVNDDRGRIDNHIIPVLGHYLLADISQRVVRGFVAGLRHRRKLGNLQSNGLRVSTTDVLSARTARHVYATLRLLMKAAVTQGRIASTPCVIELPNLPHKEEIAAERGVTRITRDEIEAIISAGDDAVPEDRRVMYSLLLLGALRFGEAAALTWRDYDAACEPLGKFVVEKSYSSKARKMDGDKTETAREMPVHPTLARILAAWKLGGFERLTGRKPQPEDLIVPSRRGAPRNVNHMLRRFHEDLTRIGLQPRRQQDARYSFIALARDDGADSIALHWVTHGSLEGYGPGGSHVDANFTWSALCAEISKVRIIVGCPVNPWSSTVLSMTDPLDVMASCL